VVTATEAKEWTSRPPQTAFPDELKDPILAAYRASGFLRADG
jgi:hypothetical protein